MIQVSFVRFGGVVQLEETFFPIWLKLKAQNTSERQASAGAAILWSPYEKKLFCAITKPTFSSSQILANNLSISLFF
jgi:hypothetical protein